MYLRHEDLIQSNQDLRDFINRTLTSRSQPARYQRE